jgi:hypothetical protein
VPRLFQTTKDRLEKAKDGPLGGDILGIKRSMTIEARKYILAILPRYGADMGLRIPAVSHDPGPWDRV